jgi:SAM-dependent methyltransferase
MMNNIQWSIDWWKDRHDNSYFPGMDWHKDWKVCPYPPPHVIELLEPKRNETILEIGCGYGEWMVPLCQNSGARICGIDIHPTLAIKASEKFHEYNCGQCEFRICNGYSIPYPDNWFNSAYSISVFQHMPRAIVNKYLKESTRVIKKGGEVLFHFRNDDSKGEYSKDISVNHEGDFSVGWSESDIRIACKETGIIVLGIIEDSASSIFLHGKV